MFVDWSISTLGHGTCSRFASARRVAASLPLHPFAIIKENPSHVVEVGYRSKLTLCPWLENIFEPINLTSRLQTAAPRVMRPGQQLN